ncbi:MAG: hypothetical protein AVDCRST_MAG67-499 [uncultured Solirubrobacteraceae bacterium]|uniref:Uncharacterized protein n=1 Tax=uncultured Solirubrobacteraceae bacterium TaxID=1162706 RepID=A0A6J4RVN0_9ACTN|nr:MAG: hypothetical protein AVDCRST_MAG67-499 [uncultured Solirubrobacteraceae bacterium]
MQRLRARRRKRVPHEFLPPPGRRIGSAIDRRGADVARLWTSSPTPVDTRATRAAVIRLRHEPGAL